ncbi:MAG: superoxide dismutase [Ni] [Planctomycetota bacterium]
MKTFSGCVALAAVTLVQFAFAGEPGIPVSTIQPAAAPAPAPHCEVPCGIYADQRRFEEMLEDTETIAKAITAVNDFQAGIDQGMIVAKDVNQLVRWINTKESHATNTQHIISQYFMTQRIKADNENYAAQLAAAHAVLVAAMKCKQDADPATAETLKNAILDLYRAYEGKEPELGHHEHGDHAPDHDATVNASVHGAEYSHGNDGHDDHGHDDHGHDDHGDDHAHAADGGLQKAVGVITTSLDFAGNGK